MKKNIKLSLIMILITSLTSLTSCGIARHRNSESKKEKNKKKEIVKKESTPAPEGFVPLAPPVIVDGSPEDEMNKKK